MTDKDGISKKEIVLNQIHLYLGSEAFSKYDELISMAVDFIKSMAKNPDLLKGLESLKEDGCLGRIISCTAL